MNTTTTVDLLNISIHNSQIKHGFLKYYEISQFYVGCILYQIFAYKLAHISCKIIIQMVKQSTITIVNRPRLNHCVTTTKYLEYIHSIHGTHYTLYM